MSTMTNKMSKAAMHVEPEHPRAVPKKGDHFRCQACGMEIEVTTACRCDDPNHVHFECCGQEMAAES